jgi:hypothetical protein
MMDRIVPDDDDAFAHKYLEAICSRDIETSIQLLDPQLNQPGVESNLNIVADCLNKGEPISMKLIGCNIHSTSKKRRSNLTYQYQFTNSWFLANVVVDTVGDKKYVMGINVNPIPKSLGELNAFTFEGRGLMHYCILIGAIVIPIFILFVLVVCIRTKMKKRKWLWIIFIILGIGGLTINWTTGQLSFNPLNFQLLGAGCYKPELYAQWTISIAFPLGAILFLLRRKKLIKEPETNEPNQALQTIVKTSVESGNEQGIAVEL